MPHGQLNFIFTYTARRTSMMRIGGTKRANIGSKWMKPPRV